MEINWAGANSWAETLKDIGEYDMPSNTGLAFPSAGNLARAYLSITAERDRYKAALEIIWRDAEKYSGWWAMNKARTALSPTPPKEP